METAALAIITLRLTVPLLILRLPLIGLLLSAAFDIVDYSIVGQHSWYQPVDKLLDLYYLSFALYICGSWADTKARAVAKGLFALRASGVLLLLLGAPEWSLIFFPNIFEMFFVFYVLYSRISGSLRLLHTKIGTGLILTSLAIPKVIQEIALHAYAEVNLPIIAVLAQVPDILGVTLWLILPLLSLWICIYRQRRISSQKNGTILHDPKYPIL